MAYSGAYGKREEPRETEPAEEPAAEAAPAAVPMSRQGGEHRFPFDMGGLFKRIEAAGMETDDLLMALILYLMYRESGDKDLLIMLGAMLLT